MAVVGVHLPVTNWTHEGVTSLFAKETHKSLKLMLQHPSAHSSRASQGTLLPSPAFAEAPRTSSMEPPPEPHSSTKKKKAAKRKTPSEIRRSASTPQLANLARIDTMPLSPTSDKRRNKLGYHRTSVACGHCRRRKIRCLLAPDDPHGRCSNCIRLKKECNFYPVEQQGPHEPRATAPHRVETGSGAPTASNPSSPRTSAISDSVDDLRRPHVMQERAEEEFAESPAIEGAYGTPQTPNFPFPHGGGGRSWEQHGYPGPHTVSEQSNPAFWRTGHPAYNQPYVGEMKPPDNSVPGSLHTSPNFAYEPRENQGFAPIRSMSLGNVEGLSQQFQYQQLNQQAQYPQSYHYPPPIDTSTGGMPVSDSSSSATSAPVIHSGGSQYGYHQSPWNSYHSQTPTSVATPVHGTYGGHWYPEPSPLGRGDEHHPMAPPYPGSHFYPGSTSAS